ncbi:MAG: cupin domain-containing protein [Pseudomonadota bacterium]
MTEKYLLSKEEIETEPGLAKTHFLNPNAKRNNKSLGDMTGLNAIGVHLIEIPPGFVSTEQHVHYHEEECVYVLDGVGEALIGDESVPVKAGDFIGYRAGGKSHALKNIGESNLRCLVVGQRLPHDVADYPKLQKRIFRNEGLPWNLVDHAAINEPKAGAKK